jgi:hypothetical protein
MVLPLALLQDMAAEEAALAGGILVAALLIGLGITVAICWGCYVIAERKGYSGILAALMGFLFGFWALLVYALLSDQSMRRDAGYGGGYAGSYSPGSYSGGTTPNMAPPPPQAQRSCWSCGNAIAHNATQCPTCGIKLNF